MPYVLADPVADRHITLKKLFRLGYYPGEHQDQLVQQMAFCMALYTVWTC